MERMNRDDHLHCMRINIEQSQSIHSTNLFIKTKKKEHYLSFEETR